MNLTRPFFIKKRLRPHILWSPGGAVLGILEGTSPFPLGIEIIGGG